MCITACGKLLTKITALFGGQCNSCLGLHSFSKWFPNTRQSLALEAQQPSNPKAHESGGLEHRGCIWGLGA